MIFIKYQMSFLDLEIDQHCLIRIINAIRALKKTVHMLYTLSSGITGASIALIIPALRYASKMWLTALKEKGLPHPSRRPLLRS